MKRRSERRRQELGGSDKLGRNTSRALSAEQSFGGEAVKYRGQRESGSTDGMSSVDGKEEDLMSDGDKIRSGIERRLLTGRKRKATVVHSL